MSQTEQEITMLRNEVLQNSQKLAHAGNVDKAIGLLGAWLKQNMEDGLAWSQLGDLHKLKGDAERAQRAYQRAGTLKNSKSGATGSGLPLGFENQLSQLFDEDEKTLFIRS